VSEPLNLVLVRELRQGVAAGLTARRQADEASGRESMSRDHQQQLAWELIADALASEARARIQDGEEPLSLEEEDRVGQAIYDALFGALGPVLGRLLEDESITDIHANGYDHVWIVRADGTKEPGPAIAGSDAEMIELIRNAAARAGLGERRFDAGSPQLDLRLPDGSRVSAVRDLSARPILSIRRHRYQKVALADLRGLGTIDMALEGFLAAVVSGDQNCIVSGATGVGKTTTLRAMADVISPEERIITIENTLELGLDQFPESHPDVVAFEAREANTEGQGAITMAELVRRSLRHSPDRVIVGEVLGDEIVPMLNALSQGNAGSICTIHANSSEGVFRRISTYAIQSPEHLDVEATNQLIAGAINFVVFLSSRWEQRGERRYRHRFVSSVREVVDSDGRLVVSNEVFRPGPDGRAVPGSPVRSIDQLVDAGFDETLLDRPDGWWDV
jgi:Flp pilus assembly CpaF family ATPase